MNLITGSLVLVCCGDRPQIERLQAGAAAPLAAALGLQPAPPLADDPRSLDHLHPGLAPCRWTRVRSWPRVTTGPRPWGPGARAACCCSRPSRPAAACRRPPRRCCCSGRCRSWGWRNGEPPGRPICAAAMVCPGSVGSTQQTAMQAWRPRRPCAGGSCRAELRGCRPSRRGGRYGEPAGAVPGAPRQEQAAAGAGRRPPARSPGRGRRPTGSAPRLR